MPAWQVRMRLAADWGEVVEEAWDSSSDIEQIDKASSTSFISRDTPVPSDADWEPSVRRC